MYGKISYPYIETCAFYSQVKIKELLDLRARKPFWNAPLVPCFRILFMKPCYVMFYTQLDLSVTIRFDIGLKW